MTHWNSCALGDAVELAYGKSLPKNGRSQTGLVPVYGSNGITGWHDVAIVNQPTVIVGRKGSAGVVQYVDRPCYPIDTTYFVRPRAGFQFDAKFLFFLLKKLDLSRLKTATGVPGLTREDAYREIISFPSIEEQHSIVDLLSRAESIVRMRREAQGKAAELAPAIFLEMFGDPVANPKGWRKAKLGDYLTIDSAVRTPDLVSDASFPCIGADSIESGTGRIVSWPTVEQIRPISGKHHFAKNDVLYSKIRPALRKVIVAPESGFCSADMYPLRPKSGTATPEFVAILLLSNAFTEYAVGVSARAQMPKVNRETLFAYEHPMPPIKLQETFANRMQDVCSIQRQQETALAQAELVFASLLGKTFS